MLHLNLFSIWKCHLHLFLYFSNGTMVPNGNFFCKDAKCEKYNNSILVSIQDLNFRKVIQKEL